MGQSPSSGCPTATASRSTASRSARPATGRSTRPPSRRSAPPWPAAETAIRTLGGFLGREGWKPRPALAGPTVERTRRLMRMAALGLAGSLMGLLAAPAGSSAGRPATTTRVLGVGLGARRPGAPLDLRLDAVNSAAPVNGIVAHFDDETEAFGISACQVQDARSGPLPPAVLARLPCAPVGTASLREARHAPGHAPGRRGRLPGSPSGRLPAAHRDGHASRPAAHAARPHHARPRSPPPLPVVFAQVPGVVPPAAGGLAPAPSGPWPSQRATPGHVPVLAPPVGRPRRAARRAGGGALRVQQIPRGATGCRACAQRAPVAGRRAPLAVDGPAELLLPCGPRRNRAGRPGTSQRLSHRRQALDRGREPRLRHGPPSSPKNIVGAWMRSTPHRQTSSRGNSGEIGLGVVQGVPGNPNRGTTFTTVFGRRR